VVRIEKAGLIPLGKTNVPEFGFVPFTEPKLYGPAYPGDGLMRARSWRLPGVSVDLCAEGQRTGRNKLRRPDSMGSGACPPMNGGLEQRQKCDRGIELCRLARLPSFSPNAGALIANFALGKAGVRGRRGRVLCGTRHEEGYRGCDLRSSARRRIFGPHGAATCAQYLWLGDGRL
jgi:Amidase